MINIDDVIIELTDEDIKFIDSVNAMLSMTESTQKDLEDSLQYVFEMINKNKENSGNDDIRIGYSYSSSIMDDFMNYRECLRRDNNMKKFKDIIFEPNVAIHCPEEWMANDLLKYADSKGYEWIDGDSYKKSFWEEYGGNTCYSIYYGQYDHVCSSNFKNETILHYNDVVIKEEGENNMETSFKYELMINGREANIGDKLLIFDCDEYFNVEILNIKIDKTGFDIRLYNEDLDEFITTSIIDNFFWEKPIIYQLPDTEGNLTEVKVGQEVWSKRHNENPVSCKIIGFDRGDITIESQQCTKKVFNVHNISGLGLAVNVTTNKPKRDFSGCMDWSHNQKAKYWVVYEDGRSFWYELKPIMTDNGWKGYSLMAGYRADLLNTDGIVEDWQDSLVERPKDTK